LGQYTVFIHVYNEAGELVANLLSGQFQSPVQNFSLSGGPLTTLGGNVQILVGGQVLGQWDGKDTNEVPVTNGKYYIKIDTVDNLGSVTSISQTVMVSRSLQTVTINVYNETGEVVRHLFYELDDPSGTNMTNVVLPSTVLAPGGSSGAPSALSVIVVTTSSPMTLIWDGRSDSGAYVSPGHYELGIHWDSGQNGSQDFVRGILVTGHAGQGSAWIQPNQLNSKNGFLATFQSGDPTVQVLDAKVYTLAGELVTEKKGPVGTTTWDASSMASGIYIALIESWGPAGDFLGRQTIKIAVLR
jgi:flagellar hook assembly protein FlgD